MVSGDWSHYIKKSVVSRKFEKKMTEISSNIRIITIYLSNLPIATRGSWIKLKTK